MEADHDWFRQLSADLIKSVEDGKPLNEGKQVADTTLASIMGRMSAYTGKLVTWDDAMKSTEDTFPKHVAFGPMPVTIPGELKPGAGTAEAGPDLEGGTRGSER